MIERVLYESLTKATESELFLEREEGGFAEVVPEKDNRLK